MPARVKYICHWILLEKILFTSGKGSSYIGYDVLIIICLLKPDDMVFWMDIQGQMWQLFGDPTTGCSALWTTLGFYAICLLFRSWPAIHKCVSAARLVVIDTTHSNIFYPCWTLPNPLLIGHIKHPVTESIRSLASLLLDAWMEEGKDMALLFRPIPFSLSLLFVVSSPDWWMRYCLMDSSVGEMAPERKSYFASAS